MEARTPPRSTQRSNSDPTARRHGLFGRLFFWMRSSTSSETQTTSSNATLPYPITPADEQKRSTMNDRPHLNNTSSETGHVQAMTAWGLSQEQDTSSIRSIGNLVVPVRSDSPAGSTSHLPFSGNIIVFGGAGAGKSSVINMLPGVEGEPSTLAPSSNGATVTTFASKAYTKLIGGKAYNVYDTAGLNEVGGGTVGAQEANANLKKLIKTVERGVNLLVFVMRGPRINGNVEKNYKMFHDTLCHGNVPTVIVITGLEEQENPDDWWVTNEETFDRYKMTFKGAACITASKGKLKGPRHIYEDEYKLSQEKLKKLLADSVEAEPWTMPTSMFAATTNAMRDAVSFAASTTHHILNDNILHHLSSKSMAEQGSKSANTPSVSAERVDSTSQSYPVSHSNAKGANNSQVSKSAEPRKIKKTSPSPSKADSNRKGAPNGGKAVAGTSNLASPRAKGRGQEKSKRGAHPSIDALLSNANAFTGSEGAREEVQATKPPEDIEALPFIPGGFLETPQVAGSSFRVNLGLYEVMASSLRSLGWRIPGPIKL